MCAAAMSFARVRRLYYGAPDPKGGAVENGVRYFSSPTCHHRPEIYSGIGESEAGELLRAFFAARRRSDKLSQELYLLTFRPYSKVIHSPLLSLTPAR